MAIKEHGFTYGRIPWPFSVLTKPGGTPDFRGSALRALICYFSLVKDSTLPSLSVSHGRTAGYAQKYKYYKFKIIIP